MALNSNPSITKINILIRRKEGGKEGEQERERQRKKKREGKEKERKKERGLGKEASLKS
jgi:hypothetical protein